jgi:hypothetical protein
MGRKLTMKRIVAVAGILAFSTLAHGAKQTINNGETMGQARTKINANFTEVYNGILIGDCTASPCYYGTTNSGTLIKLMGTDGVHWSSIQAGNVLADINWRLPLTLPGAGTTRLVNADEYGNMGLVDAATLSAANMTVVASGFDGNLATTDNTLQEIAQKVDDLNIAGGGYTNLTSFVAQTNWRLFYSDGSGDVKELALGADGEYLKSNGASSAPTWATPTGAAHDAVTLDTETAAIFSLSTQQLTLDSQTANYVLAAPNGSAGDPTFRALVAADIPTLNQNTTGTSGGLSGTPNITVGTISAGEVTATSFAANRTTSPQALELYEGTGGGSNKVTIVADAAFGADVSISANKITQSTDIDTSSELLALVTDETGSASGTPLLVFNQSPRIDSIELGAASDTTIARSGAGAITVEGVQVVLSGGSIGAGTATTASAGDNDTSVATTAFVQTAKKSGIQPVCAVIPAAVAADDYPIFKAPAALTITASSIKVYAIGGTNVVGGLDECTGTNGTCGSVTAVDSDITGTAGNEVADDGTLTNGTIASGAWVQWHTTSVSGSNTSLSVCFSYTLD